MSVAPLETGVQSKKFRQGLIKQEKGLTNDRHVLLTTEDAIRFQEGFAGAGFVKYFFGLPMPDAIRNGYKISRKGFFEATHSQSMTDAARTLKKILTEIGSDPVERVVDLFAGTGISAWAFANEGLRVEAIEKDEYTARYAEENLSRAGVRNTVDLYHTDAVKFIKDAKKKKRHFAAISLDPPWNGMYDYDLNKPFFIGYTEPRLEKLAKSINNLTDVILFRIPQNVSLEQVYRLGKELGREVIVHFQDMEGNYPKTENTGVVYLVKKEHPAEPKIETVRIPLPKI